jgi:hypothetical protein
MHCLDLADALHLRHSLAGDVLSWRRRPLVLTTDPELVDDVRAPVEALFEED